MSEQFLGIPYVIWSPIIPTFGGALTITILGHLWKRQKEVDSKKLEIKNEYLKTTKAKHRIKQKFFQAVTDTFCEVSGFVGIVPLKELAPHYTMLSEPPKKHNLKKEFKWMNDELFKNNTTVFFPHSAIISTKVQMDLQQDAIYLELSINENFKKILTEEDSEQLFQIIEATQLSLMQVNNIRDTLFFSMLYELDNFFIKKLRRMKVILGEIKKKIRFKKPDKFIILFSAWIILSAVGMSYSVVMISDNNSLLFRLGSCLEEHHFIEMSSDKLIECIDYDIRNTMNLFTLSWIPIWVASFIGFFIKFKK